MMVGESYRAFQWMGRIALIVMACLSLPMGLCGLAITGAEALYGNKQPLLLLGGAWLVGVTAGLVVGVTWVCHLARGEVRQAQLLASWAAAIGISMAVGGYWLLQFAYTFPNHKILF